MSNRKPGGQPGNKNGVGNSGGPPKKFTPDHSRQYKMLCLLDLSEKEIADFFGISRETLVQWKKKYPLEFPDTVGTSSDAKVLRAFFKRAVGFTYEETHFEKVDSLEVLSVTKNGAVAVPAYKKKVILKYIPPDVNAGIFWLCNRRKELFSRTGDIQIDPDKLTDEQVNRLLDRIERVKSKPKEDEKQ